MEFEYYSRSLSLCIHKAVVGHELIMIKGSYTYTVILIVLNTC